MYFKILLSLSAVMFVFASCKKNNGITEDVTLVTLQLNNNVFPSPNIPADNPLTVEKITLGKRLFYDPLLSLDNSVSCSSCHNQNDAFSDENQFSVGVNGAEGGRQGMAIFNLAFHQSGFFWDGRAATLREQALGPIENPLEMNETLENVVLKLNQDADYVAQFAVAFGDQNITSERIGLALENFMFSIVSDNSKFDQFQAGNAQLTASEERGRILFFGQGGPGAAPPGGGGSCVQCHGGPNFDNDRFSNIGLDSDANISDIGRQAVTGNANDRGKFKTVSLRNIAVSAPYMHDGRFSTLNAVLNHYNNGVEQSETLDPRLQNAAENGMGLNQQDRADIISFLNTLTDFTYLNNPDYSAP